MELIKPELTIRQKKMYYSIFPIIEAQTIPSRMLPTLTGIEILIRITCNITKTFHFIFYSMTMDNVHDHGYTMLMGRINKFFEFFGSSETTGCCEKTTHMVTKTSIIRMFLNRHYLNAIVSVLDDSRKNILLKLPIGAYFLCIL